ncbi:MAG: ATP-binding cassette domain-containing protein [Bacteroidales bacterium]|nr:ATP-binding cassette domain-containing protein [Bacteroidales bacterium]MBR5091893.1 ATP-binding cassette domain-containing protein [Bacteroidales bacterium]
MIEIRNLDFSYKKTPVFSDINLSFPQGAIYGLLGENGVGKTTLLKIICGLQRPLKGTCTVDGMTSHDRLPEMLQRVVFLPDEVTLPDNSTPQRYVSELAPFYPTFSQGAFLHLMQELEVEPERKFREMSFGQQKKSLIAATLSLGTDYVLLDEPTNGLDIPSKAQFRSILSKIADEGKTIIISTHQVKDVENLIDPIVILSHNAVLLDASVQKITEKLYFEYGGEAREDALYSELMPAGYMNVIPNTTGDESQLNIEALFNAVLRNKNRINELFK